MNDFSDLHTELERFRRNFKIRLEKRFPRNIHVASSNKTLDVDGKHENAATGLVRFGNWLRSFVNAR